MRQDAQKPARKFCSQKTAKKRKTHPVWAEKGKTGCVLGAGEGGSGWRRMKLGEKGRYRAGKGRTVPPLHDGNGGTDLNLLRKPTCGARLCLRRRAALPIADRCAIPASLHPPQAALRRRCPTRSACLGFTHCHYEKQRYCKCSSAIFGRGRRTCLGCRLGRLVACVPLARTRPTTRTARGAAVPRCRVLMRANEK